MDLLDTGEDVPTGFRALYTSRPETGILLSEHEIFTDPTPLLFHAASRFVEYIDVGGRETLRVLTMGRLGNQ